MGKTKDLIAKKAVQTLFATFFSNGPHFFQSNAMGHEQRVHDKKLFMHSYSSNLGTPWNTRLSDTNKYIVFISIYIIYIYVY